MLSRFFTSRNLTWYGIAVIAEALISAAVLLIDGDPNTNPDLNAVKQQIMLGVLAIAGKGAASTGGVVPVTEEAKARVNGFTTLRIALLLSLATVALLIGFAARADDVLLCNSEGKCVLVAAIDPEAVVTIDTGVDPTTGTVDGAGPADAVAQAAPDPRWSFKLGTLTVSPAVSFTPMVVSLADALEGNFTASIGPNVGAGLDWVWPTGWGVATHVTLRDTATTGAGLLGSLYAIVPYLQRYKLRPGVSYQFSDGANPWPNSLMFGFAISDNFGYPSR